MAARASSEIIECMLILASASPRRRDLLAQAGYEFRTSVANIDESVHAGENPIAYVVRLAREKAEAVHAAEGKSALVLGADTAVVAPNGEILGKPQSDQDAARMLRLLAGATHTVVTGVALVQPGFVETAAEVTYVTMRTLSDAEINAYVQSGEPRDKAGAYAIQGYAARWIPRIHGCYFNVVGLPLALVTAMIEGMEVKGG